MQIFNHYKNGRKAYQRHFDKVSSCKYNGDVSVAMARSIFAEENLRGKSVVDLGCGVIGSRNKFFLTEKQVALYAGMDLSLKALQISRKLSPSVLVVNGDIVSPPFKESSIDIIYCLGAMTYVFDIENALRETWCLLKKGGKIFVDFSKENYILSFIQAFSFLGGRLPYALKLLLAKIFCLLGFPLLRIIIGKKANWENRDKMCQVLMSSLFSPLGIRAVKEERILDSFKRFSAVNVKILDIPDSAAYSNATTFTVMAEK